MANNEEDKSIEFASKVMALSYDLDYNYSSVVNGTAAASAALLVDMSINSDMTLNESVLRDNIEKYFLTIREAVDAAVEFFNAEREEA